MTTACGWFSCKTAYWRKPTHPPPLPPKNKIRVGNIQSRKWVKLTLLGCHLSAWHYATQTARH